MNIFHFNQSEEKENVLRITYSIQGMHCVACSLNIEGELEDTSGVMSANANYAKATCTVEFDSSKIDTERIRQIVRKIGYELTPTE